jgi:hypothetical protein
MPQLGSDRPRMCCYLHEVFQRDARVAASFHNMQLELYADHSPQLLLPFLRKSSEYSPDVAFKLCKAREFVPEQVYLLGRLGNVSEALLLLLRRMRDVKAAVEFCLEHQDAELWDTLITSCFDDGALIPQLLDCIGAHPQPLRVVSRIPLGVEIQGLKDKVQPLRFVPPRVCGPRVIRALRLSTSCATTATNAPWCPAARASSTPTPPKRSACCTSAGARPSRYQPKFRAKSARARCRLLLPLLRLQPASSRLVAATSSTVNPPPRLMCACLAPLHTVTPPPPRRVLVRRHGGIS